MEAEEATSSTPQSSVVSSVVVVETRASGGIIKIGARSFFCNQKGHFRMDCPLFWEAVKN